MVVDTEGRDHPPVRGRSGHASHATGTCAGKRLFRDGWSPSEHSARRDGRQSPREIERPDGRTKLISQAAGRGTHDGLKAPSRAANGLRLGERLLER
jgi:hypothetical protein